MRVRVGSPNLLASQPGLQVTARQQSIEVQLGPTVLAVLTPTRGLPHPHFIGAMRHNIEVRYDAYDVTGYPVDVARNMLVQMVRSLPSRPEYILWADDDAYWMRGTVTRLIAAVQASRNPKRTVVAGLHGSREPMSQHHAYIRSVDGQTTDRLVTIPGVRAVGLRFASDLFECYVVGSHFFLHHVDLLDALGDAPFALPIDADFGEDFAFCDRVRSIGGTIVCDRSLPVFHCDGEFLFLPGCGAMEMVNGTPTPSRRYRGQGVEPRCYGSSVNVARNRWLAKNLDIPGASRTLRARSQIAANISERRIPEFPEAVRRAQCRS